MAKARTVTKNTNLISFLFSLFAKNKAIKANINAAIAGIIAIFSIGNMARITAKIDDIKPRIEKSNFIIC